MERMPSLFSSRMALGTVRPRPLEVSADAGSPPSNVPHHRVTFSPDIGAGSPTKQPSTPEPKPTPKLKQQTPDPEVYAWAVADANEPTTDLEFTSAPVSYPQQSRYDRPRLCFTIDDLLSAHECERLIAISTSRLRPGARQRAAADS